MQDETPPRLVCSFRLAWSVVAFFGYCILYMQRVNMGIAIVAMINNTALQEKIHSNSLYHSIESAFNLSSEKYDLINTVEAHAKNQSSLTELYRVNNNTSKTVSVEKCQFSNTLGKRSVSWIINSTAFNIGAQVISYEDELNI